MLDMSSLRDESRLLTWNIDPLICKSANSGVRMSEIKCKSESRAIRAATIFGTADALVVSPLHSIRERGNVIQGSIILSHRNCVMKSLISTENGATAYTQSILADTLYHLTPGYL